MRQISLLLAVLFLTIAASCKAQFDNLVWSDDFEEDGLPDTSKWNYDVGGNGWGNNELQYYTEEREKNARVENGKLIIEAHNESYNGNTYTSARLVTRGKADWTYGRIEVKAKLPEGVGTWPAIWMLPTNWIYGDGSWPDNGEIDIMEHVGYDPGVVHGTIHTDAYNHMDGTQKGDHIEVPTATDSFHIYALEWTEEHLRWFVDGERFFTYYNEGTGWRTWPFDHDFHLLLNIAVGGSWGGVEGVNPDAFPVKMEVDYVRVYKSNTSIEKNTDKASVEILPNPAKQHCRITTDRAMENIELWDAAGKKYAHKKPAGRKTTYVMDTGNLQAGLYIMRIKTHDGRLLYRRLVKK